MPCGQFLLQMTALLQNSEENRAESQIWGNVQRRKMEKRRKWDRRI